MSSYQTQSSATNSQIVLSEKFKYLQDALDNFCMRFSATIRHPGGAVGPQMGIYSLLTEAIPMIVYDNPGMVKICPTAFTDGQRVYWSSQFIGRLLYDDMRSSKDGRPTKSLLPLMLHELTHIICNHPARTRISFVKDANGKVSISQLGHEISIQKLACEYVVNAQVTAILRDLRKAYPHDTYEPGPIFKGGSGVSEEDCDKYFGLSETHVEQLLRMQMNNAGGGAEKGDPDLDGLISSQQLAELLDAMGLSQLRVHLDIPDAANQAAHDYANIHAQDRVISAVQKMQQLRHEQGEKAQMLPGAHIESYIQNKIRIDGYGKLGWRTAIRNAIMGAGNRYHYTEDVIAPEFFLSHDEIGSNATPFYGLHVPAESADVVAVIIDTSGSMGTGPGLLQEIGREIAGLARDVGDQVKVALIPADTAIRGEIKELSTDEAQHLTDMNVDGQGGTCFASVINQVVQYYESKDVQLAHIVYFTDLGDTPPPREDLAIHLPRISFITTPAHMEQRFADAVFEYAEVVMIEDHAQIELSHAQDRETICTDVSRS